MRRILVIGHNHVARFLRDRTSFIWLVLVPLAFTYFMGFAVQEPGGPRDPRPALRLVNSDTGFFGGLLQTQLTNHGLRLIASTNTEARVPELVIPEQLTAQLLAQQPVRLHYRPDSEPGEPAAALTELRVLRGFVDLNAVLVEHAMSQGTNTPPDDAGLRALLTAPPAVELHASFAGRRPMPTRYNLSVPGNLVMYLMMNLLIFGGASVAWERRSGVLRRLMVYPVRRMELVAGKIYGLLLLGGIQIVVLLLIGQLLFGVDIGTNLVPILITLIVYAWVAASLGVLIGSLTRSEDKVVGLCILLAIGMAALGGCWWPLEVVPDSMKRVAYIVPSAWAMDALHQLISFGGGWESARGAIGILVLYGLGANIAAARFFRS